jgi:DNA-binding NtrC family response regulator
LAQAAGNKSQAARLLNMRRTTFIEKLKRLSFPGLDEDPPSGK